MKCDWLWHFVVAALIVCSAPAKGATSDYFGIHVIDADTGRGVPLVELRLTDQQRFYTDSNGYVAFNEPGLMNQDVWFAVSSWGYEGPDATFGYKGAVLHTSPGTIAEIRIKRTNIAQRLYRTTGYGIYRDTILLGKSCPVANGLLNGKVMGQDTVQTAIYEGKMLWLWGDTDRPSFPLGNFHMSGATSALPAALDVDRGIDYRYFTGADGFVRGMAELKRKDSLPVWLDGLMVVHDPDGRPRLFARYSVTKDLVPVETGLLIYDDARQVFTPFCRFSPNTALVPSEHPTRVDVDGKEYFYFAAPYPTVRVRASWDQVTRPAAYEGYSCLKHGSSAGRDGPTLDRDRDHRLIWSWRAGVEPASPRQVEHWIAMGLMRRDESPFQMRDTGNGQPITAAGGSVAWNAYLHKWTMLFGQLGGASNLGEIWFAEANAPEGPWLDARKVATHAMKDNNDDLYNPMQHPEFARDGGRVIYFEGTLATTFENNPHPTPLYDYNNLMYKLDLSDPRMKLPEPPPGLSVATPGGLGP